VIISRLIIDQWLKDVTNYHSLTLLDCRQGGHHQREGPIVIAGDVMGHSYLRRLPSASEKFVSGGREYQQQKLNNAVDASSDTL